MSHLATGNAHKLFYTLFPFWGLILLSACDGSKALPEVDHIEVSVEIERLDQQLFELQDKQQIAAFLQKHQAFSNEFLHVDQYPHDSLAVNYINGFLSNPGSQDLKSEIDQVFGDLSHLQQELEHAFKYLIYHYPDAKLPKVYTAVTGFAGNDLFVSDSVLIIGLDYYLGEGATYRPLEFPKYILQRYSPEYIVPSVLLLMSARVNNTQGEDKTMLADMIYYGKAYYFTSQLLPAVPDSVLIGYSAQEFSDALENQDVIWAHFVDKQLLYETNHFVKKKYMDERPKTLEIGDKCPGRIGEWLGWQIVKQYADETEVSLNELMQTSDAGQIFMRSKYKPQVP